MYYLLWINLLGFQLKSSSTISNLKFYWLSFAGLEEERSPPDEDINDVEVFRDFHTSSKKA